MSEPKYVAETLAWCNAKRKAQGKAPLKRSPKGYRDDPKTCPCGGATGLHVYDKTYRSDPVCDESPLPPPVRSFVSAFDDGRLPQYEAKS